VLAIPRGEYIGKRVGGRYLSVWFQTQVRTQYRKTMALKLRPTGLAQSARASLLPA
jgi:hypothetical protein